MTGDAVLSLSNCLLFARASHCSSSTRHATSLHYNCAHQTLSIRTSKPIMQTPNDMLVGATMLDLSLLLLVLLLTSPFIILPAANGQSFHKWYDSLRELPRLSDSPTPFDRLRYEFHKIYLQYLVTGPGYVLETGERIFFDLFTLTLVGAILYCLILITPVLLRLFSSGLLSGNVRVAMRERADPSTVRRSFANMSFSFRTVVGTAPTTQRNTTAWTGV